MAVEERIINVNQGGGIKMVTSYKLLNADDFLSSVLSYFTTPDEDIIPPAGEMAGQVLFIDNVVMGCI